ncbi:Aquaporin NIP1-1 [Dendrobium catenatum]|uniref:Aquaporin NIP1-1 n=1 Tax=Dendrobium catenatum TaxID=906689 RepID=A0A2I0XG40_9ASPA|nr:Aquaporin NIP1-1 [Dendrobium catenatum]
MNEQLLAVFVSTFTFIFVGCGTLFIEKRGEITFVGVALAWGAFVAANIYTFGHISGAQINPAVTFAYALVGQFPWKRVPMYVVAEFLGCTVASLTLRWIFDGEDIQVMLTQPVGPKPASDLKVAVLETIITFIYIIANCSSRSDSRAFKELGGVAVGATVFFLILLAGKITGASMNPARSLGPAIAAWNFNKIWIYIVSPTIGSVLATTLYFFHLAPAKSKGDGKQADTSFFDVGAMDQLSANNTIDISAISKNLRGISIFQSSL